MRERDESDWSRYCVYFFCTGEVEHSAAPPNQALHQTGAAKAWHPAFGTFGIMIQTVSKPKLPKGLSYVLKTSQLEKALSEARIDCHVDLVYWLPQSGGSILEGNYWLANENVPHPRLYVRAGTVPSGLRAAASEALTESALPQFIDWLRGIIALPDESPRLHETLYFNAAYTERGLVVTDQPKYKVQRRRQ